MYCTARPIHSSTDARSIYRFVLYPFPHPTITLYFILGWGQVAGTGAAGIFISILLIIAQVTRLEDRPLLFGLFGAVFAISSVSLSHPPCIAISLRSCQVIAYALAMRFLMMRASFGLCRLRYLHVLSRRTWISVICLYFSYTRSCRRAAARLPLVALGLGGEREHRMDKWAVSIRFPTHLLRWLLLDVPPSEGYRFRAHRP